MGNTDCFYKNNVQKDDLTRSILIKNDDQKKKLKQNQQYNTHNKGQQDQDIQNQKTQVQDQNSSTQDQEYDEQYNNQTDQKAILRQTKFKKKMTIDDFEQIKVLGKGAFGTVILVKHKRKQQLYAIKVLKKKEVMAQNMEANAFMEKNVLQKNECDFIIYLKYAFQDSKRLYLVMEYISGGELYQLIKKNKRLTIVQATFILAEVIIGLEYLHNVLKVMYRDIKPENILMTKDGHIKLTDFGLSSLSQKKSYTFAGKLLSLGTPEYLAPEIIMNQGYDYNVDIWSIGILLYEMLYGQPPFTDIKGNFDNIQKKILNNKPIFISQYFNQDAINLIQSLLQIIPNERPTLQQVKSHKLFENIDWEKLKKRELTPPISNISETALSQTNEKNKNFCKDNDLDDDMAQLQDFTYNPDLRNQ